MILSAGADCCTDTTATATTTGDSTMMMTNLQQTQQDETPTDFWWWSTTTAQHANGSPMAGHQHQQISSSSQQQQQLQQQQQQQQMDTSGGGDNDEFDGFDLSLLINGTADGYFSDASSVDCRVPAAAISATVTVRTNAMLNADNECDYYPAATTTTAAVTSQQQQQLDLQQLLSIYDDMCFFSGDATEDDVKPSPIFNLQQSPAATLVTTTTNDADSVQQTKTATSPAAVVPSMVNTAATASSPPPVTTTTTTTTAANHGDSAAKTTLLRSLLTASTPLPAIALLSSPAQTNDSIPVVESTTEAVTAITTTTSSVPVVTPPTTASSKSNKHRLLIEMLRGVKNDDVVVPTAAVRPARRRPRTAAFGADDDGEIPCGARRRMDATPSPQTDSGQGLKQEEMSDEEILLYGGPYYSVPASSSWLDHMVAAAAADTTGNCGMLWNIPTQAQQQQQELNRRVNHQQRNIEADSGRDDIDSIVDNSYGMGNDFCNDYSIDGSGIFDQNGMDGGYFSVASNEVAYSPPTAAQVPSVTPPPSSCSDPSTTTKTSDDGMVQQTCWKTTDAAVSDDYYDRLLLTVMMEAAAAEPRDEDVKPVPIFHLQKPSAAVVTTTTAGCGGAAGTVENVGSSCISSSTANGNRGGDGSSNCSGNVSSADGDCSGDAASTTVDSNDPDALSQLQLKRPVTAEPRIATAMIPSTVTIPALANKPSASATGTSSSQHIHLWQFLKELLMTSSAAADEDVAVHVSPPSSPAASTTSNAELSPPSAVAASAGTANANRQQQQMIRWLDRKQGVFKIEDSQAVARLWGRRKNRPAMNYDKLSRSLRQYYKKGIMRKTERSQRLVYQFCHPYNA